MHIKTISVEYKRKFNLGDYNSLELGCALWADLQEQEESENALHELSNVAKQNVKERALPVVGKSANEHYREVFQGLPVELQEVVLERGKNNGNNGTD